MTLGKLIVLTGPSGVGKGTLVRALRQRHPNLFLSVSATTRNPRPGEVHGEDYYFISRLEFERMVTDGDFLEWAEFAGNCYGTPRKPVEQQIAQGKWVILEIELEGARQARRMFPDAVRIFILPPSLDELEGRLRGRGQDSDEAIARRLARARVELEAAGEFDFQIINQDLEAALEQIERVMIAPTEEVELVSP
jgi:guanylate kinase